MIPVHVFYAQSAPDKPPRAAAAASGPCRRHTYKRVLQAPRQRCCRGALQPTPTSLCRRLALAVLLRRLRRLSPAEPAAGRGVAVAVHSAAGAAGKTALHAPGSRRTVA